MLRSRGSQTQRQPQSRPQNSWTWESFCREEARETASAFIEKVRRFKSWNAQAREVHDTVFTNEFSAAFLEESSVLMASGERNGGSTFTASLPASVHGGLNTGDGSNQRETKNHTSSGPKSWWSGLLKWSKSRRARDRSSSGSSASSSNSNRLTVGGSTRHRRRNIRVVKETGTVQLLNLNEQENQDVMSWNLCRLVLVVQQDNYQLEIYTPPKSAIPKMSLFCFLIDEVRAATRLEIPDSESCFVIKSQNHGEYVFDVRTTALKQEWITLLQVHSSRPQTGNGHIARSTGLSSHLATLPRAPPSHENSPLRTANGTNDPAMPVVTLQSSPLMVSRSSNNNGAAQNSSHSGASASASASTRPHLEDVQINGKAPSESVGADKQNYVHGSRLTTAPTENVNSKASQESLMVDMVSFMSNYSVSTSPSRQRKTMSMFMDSEFDPRAGPSPAAVLSQTRNPTASSTGVAEPAGFSASFPYGSPRDSPPPLPKRGWQSMSTRTRPISKKNVPLPPLPLLQGNIPLKKAAPNRRSSEHILANGSVNHSPGTENRKVWFPGRKFSHPVIGSPSTPLPVDVGGAQDFPSPGNLETCSQSSSSSALHPVSLTALTSQRRGSHPTSPVDKSALGLVHPAVDCSSEEGGAWPSSGSKEQLQKNCVSPAPRSSVEDSTSLGNSRVSPSGLPPSTSPGLISNGSNVGSLTPTGCGSCPHIPEVEEEGMEEEEEEEEEKEKEVCDVKAKDMQILDGHVESDGNDIEKEEEDEAQVENGKAPPLTLKLDTRKAAFIIMPSPDEHQAPRSSRKAVTPDLACKKKIGHIRNSSCGGSISTPSAQHSRIHRDLDREEEEEEQRGSHAILTFPYLAQQQSSPAQLQNSVRNTRDNSAEASGECCPDSPLEASGFSTAVASNRHPSPAHLPSPSLHMPPQLPPSRETVLSRNSDHTNSSAHSLASSSDPRGESSAGNPIFVEMTDGQDYGQVEVHTSHPYEYWATNRQDIANLRELSQFPWFHGMISRENATQLVLANHEAGSGQYLVRQSESREGDFVLTFNYRSRAKHLRLAVDSEGCQVQHLTFTSVPAMLEYFKTNSIPLESFYLNDDVKLSTYIDRSASDSIRTTTVINVDQLNRVPPRRSRSLHLAMTRSVAASRRGAAGGSGGSGASSNSASTNSLPQSRVAAAGWRQIFRSQFSSSAGSVRRIQRSHSHNAGSIQRVAAANSGSSQQGSSENTYVWRNY